MEREKPCCRGIAHGSRRLLKSDSYLGARYRNLRQQRVWCPFAAAVKSMGRYLAVLIYRLLTQGEAWVVRGRHDSSDGGRNRNWRA